MHPAMGWVALHAVAIASALLAAFWAAVGIVVRQRVAQGVPDEKAMSATMATTLVREPLWWAGTLAAVAGYVFQALALANGSLLLVQPLLVSSLLFALPMSARLCHQRISWADWGWATLLTAALAVFVLVGQPREGHNRPPLPAWTLALALTVPLVIGCVAAARCTAGRPRAMLLAIPVAVLLGMIAVLTKICTHRFAVGGWHGLLTVPAPYVLVALAASLTVVQQAAFHAGALQASVPIMLVGEPVVAVALGVVVLGEHLAVRGSASLVLTVAVAAMTVAAIALGRDEAAEASVPTGRHRRPELGPMTAPGARIRDSA
jgi:drug/metabolite transporter (DMT)-like permease